MRASAIRKMEKGALETEIRKEKELFLSTHEAIRLGKEKNIRKTLPLRRNIARMLTVLKEMNLSK